MFRFVLLLLVLVAGPVVAAGYGDHAAYPAFEARMVERHGFTAAELRGWLAAAERKDSILEAISRPAEKRLSWGEYRKVFITPARIDGGIAFWRANAADLERAAATFGVAPEVVVAIIGVETRYGGNMGSYRVIDALATLAFDYPPRGEFFAGELEQFLVMAREQGFDPLSLLGSYAGAMGMGQFIPSSFRAYAVDFDGDRRADIWNSRADAIGSVANYFSRHGWRHGEPVVVAARVTGRIANERMNPGLEPNVATSELATLGVTAADGALDGVERVLPLMLETEAGTEYWLGLHNFYVITRYNRSTLYAMAVHQLSQAIRAGYERP
ncbi:MAG: Membrane-bound lytic murein transglycosylase B [Pseudomonadales bacterium]|nr:Membrane-bound lytic murein transglycosylase B [Pseudomonadales bacterium]